MTETMTEIRKELLEKIDELKTELENNPQTKQNIREDSPTARVINTLLGSMDVDQTIKEMHLKNDLALRAHILKALIMMRTGLDINLKLGNLTLDLFDLIFKNEDWEKYVTPKTATVIKFLYETQDVNEVSKKLKMQYTTIRSHIAKAVDRISNKKTAYNRGGGGEHAQELFGLMDSVPNWAEYVTDHEHEMAIKFREIGNFYEVGRQLGLKPGNIAGTLYGTTQKIGVIGKIKQQVLQVNRRDIDSKREA